MANRAVHCVANRQRNADLDSGRQGNGKQSPRQYAAVRADKAKQAAHDTRIKTRQGIIAKIVVTTDSKASPMTATAITSHRVHRSSSMVAARFIHKSVRAGIFRVRITDSPSLTGKDIPSKARKGAKKRAFLGVFAPLRETLFFFLNVFIRPPPIRGFS